jgi:hypothetical protein
MPIPEKHNMTFTPTKAETQSGLSRVRYAEGLISQLPGDHDGRNTWLLNYGTSDEAKEMRRKRGVAWVRKTQAAETVGGAK